VTGLGVGCVGWRKQRPQRVQCGGRVEAVGSGQGVEHIGRRGVAGKSVIAGNDETKSVGHLLQCRQGISQYWRSPSPFVCTHSQSIAEYLYICQLPIDICSISSYTIARY
jgi:hypothetical protein